MSASIPQTLPSNPEGWSKRLAMHMNFGRDGGAATYSIHDPLGNDTGIVFQYDTRKAKPAKPSTGKRKAVEAFVPWPTGFHVPAVKSTVYPTWKALHEAWPELARQSAGEAA